MQDKAPYLNTSLFIRVLLEVVAIVLTTLVVIDFVEPTLWRVVWAVCLLYTSRCV